MAFNQITPFAITGVTANSTWTTINPVTQSSGAVPSTATGIAIIASYTSSHGGTLAARMTTGSPDTFGQANESASGSQVQLIAGLGSGANANECDIYLGSTSNSGLTLECVGYFDSRASFLANAVSLGAATTTYSPYNIAGTVTGAQAAIIAFSAGPGQWGCRYGNTGASTDTWNTANTPAGGNGAVYSIVGVDSNGYFMNAAGGTSFNVMLLGWITSGITWNINGASFNRTGSCTAGSSSLLPTESGANAYLYQMASTVAANTCQVGANGVSGLPTSPPTKGSGGQLLSGSPPAANLSTTSTMSIYELAYFSPIPGGTDTLLGQGWV